jgi:threonine synthase
MATVRGMWRFRDFLPLTQGEQPVTLGEGDTPLLATPRIGARIGLPGVMVKDEGSNPTGSFKSRGLSAAITRAVAGGATAFTLPTAGNAGVAAAAYGARAGVPVRGLRAEDHSGNDPEPDRAVTGRISGCSTAINRQTAASQSAYAAESGAFDLSTLREPYRIEGKKTLGLELAEQFGWTLPDAIIYPTGGRHRPHRHVEGLPGARGCRVGVRSPCPGCTRCRRRAAPPVVKAFLAGADRCEPWPDPWTIASGLRVPGALGDRLMLRALRESGGGAVAVSDADLALEASQVADSKGSIFAPEGARRDRCRSERCAPPVCSPRSTKSSFSTPERGGSIGTRRNCQGGSWERYLTLWPVTSSPFWIRLLESAETWCLAPCSKRGLRWSG